MIIKKKTSFPYPVLGHRKGIDSLAKAGMDEGRVGDDYVWRYTIEHDNEDIENLIHIGKATYVCELDCATTNFRKCFYPEPGSESKTITVHVPMSDIGGRVHVIVTAVALEPIKQYKNSKCTPFYRGYSFDLEPGDILAKFGSWDIDLDISAESHKRITSIIQLQLSDHEEIEVLLDNKSSIVIEIPKSQFGNHEGKLKNPFYKPALLSSMVFEAIVCAIQQYAENEDKTWARVIELKARKDFGYDNLGDLIKEDSSLAFEIARKILDNPFCQLYNLLDELDYNHDLEESDTTI